MKLIRCSIVNYGCLHNFTYEFSDRINQINQPNGWGKTTLVSFLCAMLYGLHSTTRRSILENERKHYTPWQGGAFGGSLDFEISGRQYHVERFFGQKEKDDTFALYDLKTMQPSHDYSQQLGKELFGIDKSGYLSSTCVSQGQTAPKYNDTLTARLARMTQSPDDIRQYEKAISEIDKTMRFYVKTGNRGQIAALKHEADETELQLQEVLQAKEQTETLSSQLVTLQQQKEQLTKQFDDIHQKLTFFTQQEIQSHYELLLKQVKKHEQNLEQLEDFFHDQLPVENDIDFYLQSCFELTQTEQKKQHDALNSIQLQDYHFLQDLFSCKENESAPAANDSQSSNLSDDVKKTFFCEESIFTDKQKQLLIHSTEYQTEASLLFSFDQSSEDSFSDLPDHFPSADTIDAARQLYYQYHNFLSLQKETTDTITSITNQLKHCQNSFEQEKQYLNNYQPEAASDSSQPYAQLHSPLFFAAVLGILLSSFIGSYLIFPAAGVLIGLLMTVFFIYIFVHKHNQEQTTTQHTEIQLHTQYCNQLQTQIQQLQNELNLSQSKENSYRISTESCFKQLLDFAKQMHIELSESMELDDSFLAQLIQIHDRMIHYELAQQKRYTIYKKQLNFYQQLKHKYECYCLQLQKQTHLEQIIFDSRQNILQYLSSYFIVSDVDTISQLEMKLHELKTQLTVYKKGLSDMRLASQNLNTFLREHPDLKEHLDFNDNRDLNQHSDSNKLGSAKNPGSYENSGSSAENPDSGNITASVKNLQTEEQILQKQYSDCVQKISSLKTHLDSIQNEADNYPLLEEKKAELEQRISEYTERHRILSLTKDYLVKARHNFTTNYINSIEKHFNHYTSLLQKEHLKNINITSDFHILVSDHGIMHESDWYSQGTRDLIHLCSRLSIIEDLFTEETPFLIFDDPFVNFDDSSLEYFSAILHDIASKWQILYFTCHSSRNLQ